MLAVSIIVGVLWSSLQSRQAPPATGTATTTVATTTPVTRSANTVTISNVDRSKTSVLAIIAGLSSASQFNAILRSTGVAATLTASSTRKYSIFVPTNGAFGQLPDGTISDMTAEEKVRMVEYHVVPGTGINASAEVAGTAQALSGDYLNFSDSAQNVPMVNSAVIITEYTGKNGVVYLIDNVLLPPKKR